MKKINFGGIDRPVMYGINALAEFNEATNTNLMWIFKIAENPLVMNFNHIRHLVHAGLKQGAAAEGNKLDLTVDQVGELLNKEFNALKECMDELRTNGLPVFEDVSKNPKAPGKTGQ